MRVGATGQEGTTVHVQHDAPGAISREHTGSPDQSCGAMRQPSRGANAARRGRHSPGSKVDEAPWPLRVRQVATNSKGWPDGQPSAEPGKPASDARIILHDLPNHPRAPPLEHDRRSRVSRGYIGTDSSQGTRPTMLCERSSSVSHGQPSA